MGKVTEYSKVLYSFFNSIMPSFLQGNVPDNTQFPYLTYSFSYVSNLEETPIQIQIYSKSSSYRELNEKIDLIDNKIGDGIIIPCNDGTLWIKKGDPFVQIIEGEEKAIRQAYLLLNINILN